MLPSPGCDPEINVVVLGAKIIKLVASEDIDINWLLVEFSADIGVSVDHVILCLDWLYMIEAVYLDGERIRAYEAR